MQETSTKPNSKTNAKRLMDRIFRIVLIIVWYIGLIVTIILLTVKMAQSKHQLDLSKPIILCVIVLFFSPLIIDLILDRIKNN